MSEFSGKVVVVTGAGSGIGRSSALLFGRLGAKVHVTDIDEAAAKATAEEIGNGASAHRVDSTDPQQLEELAAKVFEADGHVDVLHNNAGIGHAADIEKTTVEDWQRVIGVNLLGVAYGVQAFVPRMLKQNRRAAIVNTASMAGLVAAPTMAPYSASKFGVVGMTEALDAELRPKGITVSAICPGIIDTNITRTAIMRGDHEDRRAKTIDFYSKRGASPDVVAEAVVDAVRKRKLIQPVPKSHVMPLWMLKRLVPRAAQVIARNLPRVVMGKR
jgi:NAD(P)-dependent dehydrogenase (short-subunit alcohol dehydrogenase family)